MEPPLSQFQHTLFTKEDVLKLVQTINDAVKKSGHRSLADQILTKMFDTFWSQLEAQLTEIKNRSEARTAPRPERELLEEMLEILRGQEQRVRKEREEKEYTQNWSNLIRSMVVTKEPTTVDLDAVRTYLDAMKISEKTSATKPPTAPTEPFEKKGPPKVEPTEQ